MPRTTADLVKGIVETDDTLYPSLDPFITAANQLTDEICEPEGHSEDRLTVIETWLAAHFYSVADMKRDTERAGSAWEKFQYKVDLNLNVTVYGQTAMILDTKGGLAALNASMNPDGGAEAVVKPAIRWLGTEL